MRFRGGALLGLLATLAGAALALSGCQVLPVALTGNVALTGSGQPAVGVEVAVYSDATPTEVAHTFTNAAGNYSFDTGALPNGSYRVRFSDADWWHNASSWSTAATFLVGGIASFQPPTINVSLSPAAGSVGGTVTDGSHPLGGVTVSALVAGNGALAATTTSASDGTYLLGGLPSGSYRIRFARAGLTTRFSNSVPAFSDAPTIAVATNATTSGVDTVLTGQSTISGQVTGLATGVTVSAYSADTGDLVTQVTTDTTGAFRLTGLEHLAYKLGVTDAELRYHPFTWGAPGATFTPGVGADLPVGSEVAYGRDCDLAVFVPGADLAGANLANKELDNCDLAGDDLAGANLTSADIAGANLAATNLTGATLDWLRSGNLVGVPAAVPAAHVIVAGYLMGPKADLTGADLTGVEMYHVDLTGADLFEAALGNAGMQGDVLTDADLGGAFMTGAELFGVRSGGVYGPATPFPTGYSLVDGYILGPGVDLSGAALHGIDFDNTSLSAADLSNADLTGATMTGTDFGGADLSGTDFTDTDLAGSTLINANLLGTDFTRTNLDGVSSRNDIGTPAALPTNWTASHGYLMGPGAELPGAELANFDLTGIDLAGANLSSADLHGANLTGVQLAGANLNGVRSGSVTGTPATLPYKWSIVKGYLVGPGANLTDAHLYGADLTGVDLSGATLIRVASGGIADGPSVLPAGWTFTVGYLVGPTANLANAYLVNAHLSSATLTGATLGGAKLTGADLSYVVSGSIAGTPATLPTGWTLLAGYLVGPTANLSGADFSGRSLTGFDFSTTNLTGANLTADVLVDANFAGAELAHAYFGASTLTGANFASADLSNTGFYHAITGAITGIPAALPAGSKLLNGFIVGGQASLVGAHLPGADLRGINFWATDLSSADLAGANLHGDYAENAKFTGADLSHADLGSADLQGADFAGANLTGTVLAGSNLVVATSGHIIGLPASLPTGIVLIHGYLFGFDTYTTGADFRGADLTGVNLSGYSLGFDDFTGATGNPTGGSTATYYDTTCPDGLVVSGNYTCVGLGFAP